MAKAARVSEVMDENVRRFDLADLAHHGMWLIPRLHEAYAHLKEVEIAGWVRGLIESNSFLFLRSSNAVGLAEVARVTLSPLPTVREHFVLARTPDHVEEAAQMYDEFLRWARMLQASSMEVNVHTDVPAEMVRAHLGLRVFTIEKHIVKL